MLINLKFILKDSPYLYINMKTKFCTFPCPTQLFHCWLRTDTQWHNWGGKSHHYSPKFLVFFSNLHVSASPSIKNPAIWHQSNLNILLSFVIITWYFFFCSTMHAKPLEFPELKRVKQHYEVHLGKSMLPQRQNL